MTRARAPANPGGGRSGCERASNRQTWPGSLARSLGCCASSKVRANIEASSDRLFGPLGFAAEDAGRDRDRLDGGEHRWPRAAPGAVSAAWPRLRQAPGRPLNKQSIRAQCLDRANDVFVAQGRERGGARLRFKLFDARKRSVRASRSAGSRSAKKSRSAAAMASISARAAMGCRVHVLAIEIIGGGRVMKRAGVQQAGVRS